MSELSSKKCWNPSLGATQCTPRAKRIASLVSGTLAEPVKFLTPAGYDEALRSVHTAAWRLRVSKGAQVGSRTQSPRQGFGWQRHRGSLEWNVR